MKNQKILVDREPLRKEFIQSKQEFEKVLSCAKVLKPPVWKTPWFYGPVGLATIAVTVSAVSISPMKKLVHHQAKTQKIERILQKEVEKIDKQTLAVVSPIENQNNSIRKTSPKQTVVNTTSPKLQKDVNSFVDEEVGNISQPKLQTKVKVASEKDIIGFPNIGNVYTGEIDLSLFCSEEGITCKGVKIQSFSIQYYNGVKEVLKNVSGNNIPDETCEAISKYNWGSSVFITEINGVDNQNNSIQLPSMMFIPH